MNGNSNYNHRNVGILSVEAIEAPEVVTSDWIDEQLTETYQRWGLRPGLLAELAGIKERRWWPEGVTFDQAAAMAGRKAIDASGIDQNRIGMMISTSVCKHHLEPSVACAVHSQLGLPTSCTNFDLANACLGFVNAVHLAATAIDAGFIEYALIVDGEGSRYTQETTIRRLQSATALVTDVYDEFASLTLGSGAAAMVLGSLETHPDAHQVVGGVARAGTEHHELVVEPDAVSLLHQLVWHFDEPFADASALPTLRVCALAREHVTVALSGDGADEALAGYRRQVFQLREDQMRALLPAKLRVPLFGTAGRLYPKADWAPRPLRAKATLQALGESSEAGYARALSVLSPELRDSLYSPEFHKLRGDYRAEAPLIALMQAAPARSGLDRAQYADLKFWLPGDILTKVDRTSMAVGLEAREPLLDHRLVEFAATLPERMRVRGRQGKWLMKHVMRRSLPDEILFRPKMGFVTPISAWLRGPLAGEARKVAASGALARTGWFDGERLRELVEAHIAGRSDHARLIWQLLMLERSLVRLGIA